MIAETLAQVGGDPAVIGAVGAKKKVQHQPGGNSGEEVPRLTRRGGFTEPFEKLSSGVA
jgi:hypothetical protein